MGLNTLHNKVTVQAQARMWTWSKGPFLGDTAAEWRQNMHP